MIFDRPRDYSSEDPRRWDADHQPAAEALNTLEYWFKSRIDRGGAPWEHGRTLYDAAHYLFRQLWLLLEHSQRQAVYQRSMEARAREALRKIQDEPI